MIWGLVIFLVTLVAKLNYDLWQYHSRKTINHAREAAVVFILLTVASWLSGWISAPMWFLGFWILFNGIFNILIGQKWGYLGSTAKLDILETKYKWITAVKYALFIASVIINFI